MTFVKQMNLLFKYKWVRMTSISNKNCQIHIKLILLCSKLSMLTPLDINAIFTPFYIGEFLVNSDYFNLYHYQMSPISNDYLPKLFPVCWKIEHQKWKYNHVKGCSRVWILPCWETWNAAYYSKKSLYVSIQDCLMFSIS